MIEGLLKACRPLSKRKSWRLSEILRREKIYDAEAAAKEAAVGPSTGLGSSTGGVNVGFAASAVL